MRVEFKIQGIELFVSKKNQTTYSYSDNSKPAENLEDITFKIEDINITNEMTTEELQAYFASIPEAIKNLDLEGFIKACAEL